MDLDLRKKETVPSKYDVFDSEERIYLFSCTKFSDAIDRARAAGYERIRILSRRLDEPSRYPSDWTSTIDLPVA